MKLYKNIFLTDWHDKRLKNTMDLLLFYEEHFYGFSESDAALADGLLTYNYSCTFLTLHLKNRGKIWEAA